MTVIAKAHTTQTRRTFDQRKYGKLLAQATPAVITTKAELEHVEAEITKLLRKGENLTLEEDRLLDLLSALVERYEDETEDFPDSPPHRLLKFLLEQNDLQPEDLVKIFGSRERVAEAISGERSINKTQAKSLAKFFNVTPDLFV
jgi:HTH-type transcriptional regulator/antitoxin HigA